MIQLICNSENLKKNINFSFKPMFLLSFFLLYNNAVKCQSISYNELISWINASEYPGYMFSKLEEKGYSYFGEVNEGKHCKGHAYFYNDKVPCSVTSIFCDDFISAYVKDIEIDRSVHFRCNQSGMKIYEELTRSIIQYCKKIDEIESQYNGLTFKTFVYFNNKNIYFYFHKYLSSSSGMGYFIIIEKSK